MANSPADYPWQDGEYESFVKIYMVYGKQFPLWFDISQNIAFDYNGNVPWNPLLKFNIVSTQYDWRKSYNEFTDEFIKYIENCVDK